MGLSPGSDMILRELGCWGTPSPFPSFRRRVSGSKLLPQPSSINNQTHHMGLLSCVWDRAKSSPLSSHCPLASEITLLSPFPVFHTPILVPSGTRAVFLSWRLLPTPRNIGDGLRREQQEAQEPEEDPFLWAGGVDEGGGVGRSPGVTDLVLGRVTLEGM